MEFISNPLIEELKKLRESSKYAVAQGTHSNLNEFKKYLHIEREVEKKLKTIITHASVNNKSQLLLVCGNVGDGKSHILSHLDDELKDVISQFTIHNDATESHNPNETSNETLYKLLEGFKDDKLQESNDKIILAINLGTLSKFIEEYTDEFKCLKKYILHNKILDTDLIHNDEFDATSNFHHVNFTDYHLYSLTSEGAISELITTLFERIVAENDSNSLYKAYVSCKEILADEISCPILYNYEFLFSENNRQIIAQLIIKAIVKSKEIVSLRTLLNFIYDIIVPVDLADLNTTDYAQRISNFNSSEFLANLLPNYIFEHPELSSLFEKIEHLDPCLTRDAATDEVLLSLMNASNPVSLFKEHIDSAYINTIQSRLASTPIVKNSLARFYIRLNFFSNYYKSNSLKEVDYEEYLIWLYHYNINNPIYIEKIYGLVDVAVRNWNGDAKTNGKVIINVGKKQTKFRVFKDFDPIPDVNLKPKSSAAILHKFMQEFGLTYKINEAKESLKIHVDYSLFKTLKMVSKGYRPNKKDNNNFVYFVNAITTLTNQNNQKASLYIDEINIGKAVDYQFSKNPFGGYTFQVL
jgi:DNA phosphorothioation-dependent restriction protein DptF